MVEFFANTGVSLCPVLGAQLDNEGEYLVIELAIVRKLVGADECLVEFCERLHHIEVNLEVSALHLVFRSHHFAEIGVPLFQFLSSITRKLELAEVVFAQTIEITTICTEDVFHLPHVEEIFCAIMVSESVGYKHDLWERRGDCGY